MAQGYIMMNGIRIWQPDEELGYNLETTYTQDSKRAVNGVAHFTAMFTVEQLEYKASYIPVAKVSEILRIVGRGLPFTLHYFSPFYGAWRDARFYVPKNSTTILRLVENGEKYKLFSFKMTGVNPV